MTLRKVLTAAHCVMEADAVTQMPALKALTLNDNRRLSYVHPAFIQGCPSMEALDLSRNSLYALERGIQASVPSLRALYLAGNSFNCHCRSVPNLDNIIILSHKHWRLILRF